MRTRLLFFVIAMVAACGDNIKGNVPVDARVDGSVDPDARPDAMVDATLTTPSQQIAEVKASPDGELTPPKPIMGATVTYLKPQIGSSTNDPAGFTVQADQMGPAIFVAVDPASLVPAASKGDVVSFMVTAVMTVGGQKRATAITDFSVTSSGADVAALSQNITGTADVVSAINNYDSEIIDVTGTVASGFTSSGAGFEKAQINTNGLTGNTSYVLRVPATLRDAIDLVNTCTFMLNDTPVGRFNAEAQLAAFSAADITVSACPAPTVVGAIALTPTQVRVTFSRRVLASSVSADGSQFTFDNGLMALSAVVDGPRSILVTTTPQTSGLVYTVTVAASVTDLQGSALGAPSTAMFTGFLPQAVVRVNEVNANIAQGCDLIELRVITSGSMVGIRVQERVGAAANQEMSFEFGEINVVANQLLVLHLDANDTTNCNPGNSMNETSTVGDRPNSTYARNYDTAFDVFSTDEGLTATDNVITVYDRFGAISDVVLVDNGDNSTGTATEAAAANAAAANQWQMVGGGVPAGGFADANFTAHAVLDSDAATTVSHTGANSDSLGRIDNTDENDKADWAQAANTWGLLNAGQTPL